ncbi:MAG: glycoside hydrolase family 95 protein [Bacteroidales bacterium]|jgi:alpha-L-fucosidase 2|nr:glycoside hydrolase family 95 protein [Bacteroidales bacterium]NLM91738.1 glycoside hydrolase family 95 protein [Bacteroidales bacterium]
MKYLKSIRLTFLFLLAGMLLQGCLKREPQFQDLLLWYDEPAQDWMTEALPLGNGHMGVMFFGDPDQERLQFSEGTLWAGGPGSGNLYNFGLKEGAAASLPLIRELMEKGEREEAYRLTEEWMTGITHPRDGLEFGDYGAQQTMGDLLVSVECLGEVEDYRRELNLNAGQGKVLYSNNGVHHKRTYFGCFPLKAMVYHFENDAPDGLDYSFEIQTPHLVDSLVFFPGVFNLYGHMADNGLAFLTSVVFDTDGEIDFKNGKVVICSANSLSLKHTAFTAYMNRFPEYKNDDWLNEAIPVLEALVSKDFLVMEAIHREDYQGLFNRLQLEFNPVVAVDIPTDRRLTRYATGAEDHYLEVLYLQYARYLMISSSRSGTMPMHLQGKWNNSTEPPWACDYHTNINLQMLYWPAEVANLSECHTPLFDHLKQLLPPGRLAAEAFFGTKGWVVNTMNNAYGYTSPGWGLPWGYFPAGAAWLTRHAWEHFEFTRDTSFLRNTAFPLMEEAALFWEDYLTKNEAGFLVSVPSFSPEHGGISSGASMDHQIAWDLFNNCAIAAGVLGLDEAKINHYAHFRDLVIPPLIGRWGQLQEWVEDVDDPDNTHRHLSHLYALHPGRQISMNNTPELAQAVLNSLEARGREGTGWSLAWKINFYARLQNGNEAYKLLRRLLKQVGTTEENMSLGGTYNNLLCAHPPFQLDGNMGGAAGMAEMIVQSHEGMISLLPALPEAWPSGRVSGMKTRGGFELAFQWKKGRVKKGSVKGNPGAEGELLMGGKRVPFTIPASGVYKF